MKLDFETLKSGFIDYLETCERPWKKYKTDDEDVSVFMYTREFKKYLEQELNCDGSICFENIEDIMKMDFVDGQIENPQEIQESDEVEAQDENQYINKESAQNYALENDVDMENPELIVCILNDLLTDATFKETLDKDGDGEINDEELKSFFDVVKCYDGDESAISLDDIISAAKDIKYGIFRFATDKEIKQIIGETPKADAIGLTNTSGSTINPDFTAPEQIQKPKYDENGKAILENMNSEELEAELNSAKDTLSEKQDALSAAQQGTSSELISLKEQQDRAYELYQEQLELIDVELKEKLDNKKDEIDAKESEINDKDREISDQKCYIADCEANVANCKSYLSMLQARLAELEAANEDGEYDDLIAQLRNVEIPKAQKELDTAEQELNIANEGLVKLEDQKQNLEDQLDALNEEYDEIEQEIANKYPQLEQYQQDYKDAQDKYNEYKTQAIAIAQKEVQEAQEYLNEVQTALAKSKEKEKEKEFTPNSDGDKILEYAKEFLGMSETQVEAVCGYNLPDGLWCAAFVKYILQETGTMPDWYDDCNYNSCSDVYAQAYNNNAVFKDATQAQVGDLVIFNTSRGQARHIGIVQSVENGVITTIEGNSGKKVSQRTYEIGTDRINSFVKITS